MTPEETAKGAIDCVKLLQTANKMMLKTIESLVERAERTDKLLIGLKYQVLHLKVALCLSWIFAAAASVWARSQC